MVADNPYRDRVNQKLRFARLLLTQGSTKYAEVDQNRHLEQALLEAAVLHLCSAYRLYLREVASNYQASVAGVVDLETLSLVLAELQKVPSEVQELTNLSADTHSWLSQILAVSDGQIALEGQHSSQVRPFNADSAIASITLSEDSCLAPGAEQISSWHTAFVDLIERQRELMIEC